MSATTDVPFASNAAMIPYHRAIVHFVAGICWQDDGTPEALAKATYHRSNDFSRPGQYEKEIQKIWKKFDAPEDIVPEILWEPQGGRASKYGFIRKDNLFGK